MHKVFIDKLKLLNPIEISITVYLVCTGILALIFHNRIEDFYLLVLIRILLLGCILFLSEIDRPGFVEFLRTFLPIFLLGYLYGETDRFNNLFFQDYLDYAISSYDSVIFGFQPALVFARTFSSQTFAEIMYFGYFSYYLIIFGIPLFFYLKGWKNIAEKIIFLMVHSFLLFYIIFIFLPVAGPQYYFSSTTLPEIKGLFFAKIIHFIQFIGEKPTGAFPSSHVSVCLIMLWICLNYKPIFFYFLIPVAIILMFSTIYIGAHYGIDVLAAILVTPFIYLSSSAMYNRLTNRPLNISSVWMSQ